MDHKNAPYVLLYSKYRLEDHIKNGQNKLSCRELYRVGRSLKRQDQGEGGQVIVGRQILLRRPIEPVLKNPPHVIWPRVNILIDDMRKTKKKEILIWL
jgi:hypothetical protein